MYINRMIKVGQRLSQERERKKLTIQDVWEATKIRKNFLEAIENGEYEKLPSSTVAYGFVKNYVRFLHLPEKEVMALFRREYDEDKIYNRRLKDSSYKVLPTGFEREDFPLTRSKNSKFFLIVSLFIVLLGFIFFQYKDAILSPGVSVLTPKQNEVLYSTTITVSGKTNPENVVFVNSFPVSVDEVGNFKKIISVFSGKNIIKIKIINRFNKVTEVEREVEVKTSS